MHLRRTIVIALTVALFSGQTFVAVQRAACAMPRGGNPPSCARCAGQNSLTVASLVADRYVIQLDSDTLTVGPIDEVRRCIAGGTSFKAFAQDTNGRLCFYTSTATTFTGLGMAPGTSPAAALRR